MNLGGMIFTFMVGGSVTALIVGLEESGRRTWSGLAALVPVFTIVSYFFIGASKDAMAVSQHSKFVLVGTLVSWVPYMAAELCLHRSLVPIGRSGSDSVFSRSCRWLRQYCRKIRSFSLGSVQSAVALECLHQSLLLVDFLDPIAALPSTQPHSSSELVP